MNVNISTKEIRIFGISILIIMFCILMILNGIGYMLSSLNTTNRKMEQRLEFLMEVIRDYDKPIQFDRMLDDESNSYELRYGTKNRWRKLRGLHVWKPGFPE